MKLLFFVTVLSFCLLQDVYGDMDPPDDTLNPVTFGNFLSLFDKPTAEWIERDLGFVVGNFLAALLFGEEFQISKDPAYQKGLVGTVVKVVNELLELLGMKYTKCVYHSDCLAGYSCERTNSPAEGILGFCLKEPMVPIP
ncbi:hypothetical protein Avbf_07161 [Armadillidium vulgare]|nr:hypothetical protein Avbf_07161 [Armadillidium vulgare]